ncbi:hypothetical protein MBAV_001734 [Candidatus Magnetobacterium bavaricum]|uniref:Uncharacterized protein n=1 Tax=Candidatus Magnetobacterium bavaricum TaxID=29290 RepID=A0A0F3GVS2_9BACT|nr:hypothetical protein MBAV_001734 [Candidatus Magnetobacterium bavaricum]
MKNPDTRAKLVRYQEECYEVLFEHFNGGKAADKPAPIPEPVTEVPRKYLDTWREGDYVVIQLRQDKRAIFNGEAIALSFNAMISGEYIYEGFKLNDNGELAKYAIKRAVQMFTCEVAICNYSLAGLP